jgi:hypothetical protein
MTTLLCKRQYIVQTLVAAAFASLAASTADADSCSRSREYLLGGLAGELPQPPESYKPLFNMCLETANLSNVKDSFILKDGGIGVITKRDSVAATAATLAEFCQKFPRATLRFATKSELLRSKSITELIKLSSGSTTSCRKIRGLSDS